jgi:uncharacterized protein (DUF608 family)
MLRNLIFVLSVPFVLLVLSALPAYAGVHWDFEDGTLQGWTVVSGDAGKQPVDKDDDRSGGNFNKQGRYFIGTYENLRDEAQVEYRSPVFTITSGRMTLLVGGGNHRDHTYIALYGASDDSELFRETGTNSETMQRRYWDVSPYRGQAVYLKVIDRHSGGWGHINIDDIREISEEEVAKLEQQRAERDAANRRWLESLMSPAKRKVYKGKEITDLAMPLGGIGAGNIAVCGDGALREWQIFNKVNSACIVPGQFFGVWAKAGDKQPVARILQMPSIHGLTEIRETEFIGEFPIAEIRYKDAALPVEVSMEAFSPFIPMNSKDSGIPGIFFVFRVKNPGGKPVEVSLVASLQNAVNYDGRSKIDGVRFQGYGGNVNEVVKQPKFTALRMSNPGLPTEERQFGTMVLGTLSKDTSALAQWDIPEAMWADFSKDGAFSPTGPTGQTSRKGRTWNGALAVPVELRPGEEKSIVFFITWSFPNFYAEYDKNLAQYRLGRAYANWFADALAAAEYLASNYDRLAKETRLFRDTFYDSSLPYWFLDRVLAPASTLTSQVCLWIEDGGFHAFEGAGCCPMNCTHVWNYEQTLSCLFPDLERKMRHTDLKVQQEPSGAVRHRTVLPLSIPRGTGPFVDGHLGTILKSYREYRLSPDRKWLDEMWPNIKSAMDFAVREWDPNKDGVLVNEQWNTYDAAMYGPNTFIGTLYLSALLAAEKMALVEDDTELAGKYRGLFEIGSKRLDSVVWNGEYYIHIDEKTEAAEVKDAPWLTEDWPEENNAPNVNRPYGTGCHADQFLGQWWANILDLGYLLPKERVAAALDSIMKYDWRWDFGVVPQQRTFASSGDKGLLNCTWPHDGRPENYILYADEAWTGIEYEVAGLLICEGKIREAYQVVKAVSDRYNGVPNPPFKRSPWNEIECGEHYARAMSSWGMLLAAQGISYCGPEGSISFDPRIRPENHRSFFSTAEGWGTFSQKRTSTSQTDTLYLAYGRLSLRTLTIHLTGDVRPESIIVALGRKSLKYEESQDGNALTIGFAQPITLTPREKLSVEVEW